METDPTEENTRMMAEMEREAGEVVVGSDGMQEVTGEEREDMEDGEVEEAEAEAEEEEEQEDEEKEGEDQEGGEDNENEDETDEGDVEEDLNTGRYCTPPSPRSLLLSYTATHLDRAKLQTHVATTRCKMTVDCHGKSALHQSSCAETSAGRPCRTLE